MSILEHHRQHERQQGGGGGPELQPRAGWPGHVELGRRGEARACLSSTRGSTRSLEEFSEQGACQSRAGLQGPQVMRVSTRAFVLTTAMCMAGHAHRTAAQPSSHTPDDAPKPEALGPTELGALLPYHLPQKFLSLPQAGHSHL